jgi:hypothetical protein
MAPDFQISMLVLGKSRITAGRSFVLCIYFPFDRISTRVAKPVKFQVGTADRSASTTGNIHSNNGCIDIGATSGIRPQQQ